MDTPLTALKLLLPTAKQPLLTYMPLRPKLDGSGLVHCFFPMWHITLMCRVVGTAIAEVKQRAGFDSQEVFGDQPPKAFTWAPCLRFFRGACSTFRSFLVSFKH